jgi:hypothetical protein
VGEKHAGEKGDRNGEKEEVGEAVPEEGKEISEAEGRRRG